MMRLLDRLFTVEVDNFIDDKVFEVDFCRVEVAAPVDAISEDKHELKESVGLARGHDDRGDRGVVVIAMTRCILMPDCSEVENFDGEIDRVTIHRNDSVGIGDAKSRR